MYLKLGIEGEKEYCYRLHVGKGFPEEFHFMSVNLLSINMSLKSVVAQWGLDVLAATHTLPC